MKPYEVLYNKIILPRDLEKKGQGPQLSRIQDIIAAGEDTGSEKFSGDDIDTSEFTDEDWYALCLFRTSSLSLTTSNRSANTNSLGQSWPFQTTVL